MVERKLTEYLIAAVVGIALFVLVIGGITNMIDRSVIRDCEAMGTVMLKGKPYRCEPMEDPRNG